MKTILIVLMLAGVATAGNSHSGIHHFQHVVNNATAGHTHTYVPSAGTRAYVRSRYAATRYYRLRAAQAKAARKRLAKSKRSHVKPAAKPADERPVAKPAVKPADEKLSPIAKAIESEAYALYGNLSRVD